MSKIAHVFHVDAFIALGIASLVADLQDSLDAAPSCELRKTILLIADKAKILADYGRYNKQWQQGIDHFGDMRFRILYDDDEPMENDLRDFAKVEFPAIQAMAETIMHTAMKRGMEESCVSIHTPNEVQILMRKYFNAHFPS